ncbi:MAG: glycoside hydrolase family 38 C-terminal domain-containing protein [Planctomycetota bacterium]|nr:glycoside hydrolase family 38 C-terminal domain-containing protein [Planctomycetota bacterium]
MSKELELTLSRAQVYLRDVIEALPFRESRPAEVGMTAPGDQIPVPSALSATYAPAAIGQAWGPKWSTAWFRLRAEVPRAWAGEAVALRFSSGTEAMLWDLRDPARPCPVQGLDVNRDTVRLLEHASGGEKLEAYIEAACNHPFGVLAFEWDHPEVGARWNGPTPGRLERAEIVTLDEAALEFVWAFRFLTQLAKELDVASTRGAQLITALRDAMNAHDPRDRASIARARAILEPALTGTPAGGSATICHAVGHAHIDTAWLWPLRETRRKCLRSFSNVLRCMERDPEFIFLCSQAQQYQYVKEDAPALYDQIRARVAEGRWEPGGAMWIESDINVISGESIVRQILHGTRFWEAEFGSRGQQRFLYLPDTFGFGAALPQIMKLSGLDTFITNKLSWNQFNTFPHTHFVWRGIDGSEVLGHQAPGHDYNACNTPRELRRGETNHKGKHLHRPDAAQAHGARWLQPFGYGDGGGGPTEWSVRFARYSASSEGLPKVKLSRVADFLDELHADREALRARGRDFPIYSGELYLELHRGTLTTQGWIKRANRLAEEGLREVEWLGAATPAGESGLSPKLRERLDSAWKTVLLNQFHDIIPGSSITPVYDDARADHARVAQTIDHAREKALNRWLECVDARRFRRPALVLNASSTPASRVVELVGEEGDELAFARDVPALGMAIIEREAPANVVPVSVGERELSNGLLAVKFDKEGRIISFSRPGLGRDACEPGKPMNQLVLYEDRPVMWDAWDVDFYYEEKPRPVAGGMVRIKVVQDSPLRGEIVVSRTLGEKSRIEQTYRLDAGSHVLEVRTRVDWREKHTLLRASFPTAVRSARCTAGTQFGFLERPTHRSTTRELAQFEFPAHGWLDLSEPGLGVALLTRGKFGHSCHDGAMGLSLLRAPVHPDPQADQGEHEFEYGLIVHEGDFRAAGVDAASEAFQSPMRAIALNPDGPAKGRLGYEAWSPFRLEFSAPEGFAPGVRVAAFKPAEEGSALILRLHEAHGVASTVAIDWTLPVANVAPVNLLERSMALEGFSHAGQRSTLNLRPFQIVTLAITPS